MKKRVKRPRRLQAKRGPKPGRFGPKVWRGFSIRIVQIENGWVLVLGDNGPYMTHNNKSSEKRG